jgi:hypothetical protein
MLQALHKSNQLNLSLPVANVPWPYLCAWDNQFHPQFHIHRPTGCFSRNVMQSICNGVVLRKYSVFIDKVVWNCHFLATGWNCMNLCQALQSFSNMSQVYHHKTIKCTYLYYRCSWWKPESDRCIELYWWIHYITRTVVTGGLEHFGKTSKK